jgi:putative chitinase
MNPIELLQTRLGLKADGQIGRITFGAMRMHWNLTGIQLAHFLGQCEHETGGFRLWSESLNYSSQGLLTTFRKYYADELLAIKHQRKPSVIANHVYGNRMGNNQPNDGWHFRGRGAIQLTGRNNYTAFANWKRDSEILVNPDIVATNYAFDSALWFFETNKLWKLTLDLSEKSITEVSKAINLGNPFATANPNGMKDRIEKTLKYSKLI